jgi:hypothetical protein
MEVVSPNFTITIMISFQLNDENVIFKQEAQGPHRSPESYWLIFGT